MMCSRGVLYVTPICNLKCIFCYYRFIENRKHPSIDSLKKEADRQRFSYDLNSTDLTGFGEPTLHPEIVELIRYCDLIGLKPTIITNGQNTEKIAEILNLGKLNDLLLSVHDIGEDYEKLTGVKGSWKNMQNTLELLKERNFRFRVNVTVTELNRKHLKTIIDKVQHNARMIDFILFNPHEGTDWTKHNNDFQATYTEASKDIKEAIHYAEKKGLIANVRYIPLCMMKGFEKHVINFHQWIYDKYGWEECHGNRIQKFAYPEQYLEFIKQKISVNKFPSCCDNCANRKICDGIYPQYLNKFGSEEFIKKEGEIIEDPMFYRNKFLEENKEEFA